MARPPRAAEGGLIYHAMNRANARMRIFEDEGDYATFAKVLAEVATRTEMRLLAYCVMPDHFHLVVWPRGDGDLSNFMRLVTLTHTQRWHARRRSAGTGHLYQGRFKSFPIQGDEHFLTACRFVESNALRSGLVDRAESWLWGSLSLWSTKGSDATRPRLTPWPIPRPRNWVARVNAPISPAEDEAIGRSLRRGQPFGDCEWQTAISARLGLESTFRPRGRPKKRPETSS
jgi:putative transposase